MEHKGINAKAWFYGQPGFHGQSIEAARVVCSTCHRTVSEGSEPVSHLIMCPECLAEYRAARRCSRPEMDLSAALAILEAKR